MLKDDIDLIANLYARFNARDIDGVLLALADNVQWANAMEGGHEDGRDAVRAYWTRQWSIVSPYVEPVGYSKSPDGDLVVEVLQTVFDLEGRPLQGEQDHNLRAKTVKHIFRIAAGQVTRFDVSEGE